MTNRSRLYDLPDLRSSRSTPLSLNSSRSLTRPDITSLRALSDPISSESNKTQSITKRIPSLSSKQQLSPVARSGRYLEALPLNRLSLSDNAKSKVSTLSTTSNRGVSPESLIHLPKASSSRPSLLGHDVPSVSSSKLFDKGERSYRESYHSTVPSQPVEVQGIENYRCLVGLSNLGNTCFMASQLQSLGCLSEIIRYFAENNHVPNINTKSPSKGRLVQAFSALMVKLRRGPDGQVIRPSDIKDVLGSICRRFSGYAQQDSQEFLRTLLCGIHDDINEIRKAPPYSEIAENPDDHDDFVSDLWWNNYIERNRSFITSLFCGQLKSQSVCTDCSHRSRVFDPFWDLSLQMKTGTLIASSLEDCFKIFTAEESISDYYCSKCKRHVTAKRRMSIHRFPEILVVHLKRFEFSSVFPRKLDAMITFPLQGLDLSMFASETARLKPPPVYDLKAVSNHYGSTSGGHYTAMGMISPVTWAEFNDSSASKISASAVCSSAAYVLFFRLRLP